MTTQELIQITVAALEDLQAIDISLIDVRSFTSITDYMIIASGSSNRHVKALTDNLLMVMRKSGNNPFGVEGTEQCSWVLVDFTDIVIHIMQASAREFYDLETLWSKAGRKLAIQGVEDIVQDEVLQ